MFGKMANSSGMPYALGIMPQSSVYGMTIPSIFGCSRTTLSMIWARNLRQQGNSFKTAFKKNAPKTYVQNADFILGSNPIAGVLQMWFNNGKLPLVFPAPYTVAAGAASITVPDANFYFILGVTVELPYDVTFEDYGSGGSSHLVGTFEKPLWNSLFLGPDPTNPSGARWYPFIYQWFPNGGPTIFLDGGAGGQLNGLTVKIYYAKIDTADGSLFSNLHSGTHVPIAACRLGFEPKLGGGSEYSSPHDYTAEQILYPHYAGLGAVALDLGTSQMVPNILPEVMGSYPLYSRGDADFADMVEDIFKMGLSQAAFDAENTITPIQRGLACFDFPGAIQKVYVENAGNATVANFNLPNQAGDILLAFVRYDAGSGTPTIADSAGNVWTLISNTPIPGVANEFQGIWRATAVFAATNAVTITGSGSNTQLMLFELPAVGVDTLDTVAEFSGLAGSSPAGSIITSGDNGAAELLIAFVNTESGVALGTFSATHWSAMMPSPAGGVGLAAAAKRLVNQPGTYTIGGFTGAIGAWTLVIIAYKLADPAGSPRPLGDILDPVTMQQTRDQCRAFGLIGSMVMDSQKKASDWLAPYPEDPATEGALGLFAAMNAAPVWSGDKLKVIPWSEVSEVGNGAIYIAPTASGPIFDLDASRDMIGDSTSPPITITRKARVDAQNILQIQHPSRDADYNDVVTSQPEIATISLFGWRKANPVTMPCVHDAAVARMILGILSRRRNFLTRMFHFKLKAEWGLLEAMDLVTINDDELGISGLPVRLTSITEDENYDLECEAEDFLYGVHGPQEVPITVPAPYQPETGVVPALVNAPVIFEPVPRLLGTVVGQQNEVWLVVSDSDPEYGGCIVYMSTDGGVSYNPVGTIQGNGITGTVVVDWPAAADPDTVNNLQVDLTESLGALASYSQAQRDAFQFPAYVAGGSIVPYELTTYGTASLTAANKYTLRALGAFPVVGLRRGVYGAPLLDTGVDHPPGSRFAFIGDVVAAVFPGGLHSPIPATFIGTTLHFKFQGFNTQGGGYQDISSLVDYTYTVLGTINDSPNYTNDPAVDLTQTTATNIHMGPVSVRFDWGTVKYNARDFVIPDPGVGVTVIYYVTVADPTYIGDEGALTNLTAYCETSQAKVGVKGYTYIGSIYAVHTGFGTVLVTPGGWPQQQLFLINGV